MKLATEVGISVALPVHGGAEAVTMLQQAAACILGQTHRELDVMIVLNGANPELNAAARAIAFRDARVRLLERREANLAAALNAALEAARYDLVARMDADDLCPPERLEKQVALLHNHPELAAVGCAWELLNHDGSGTDHIITVVRPPTDPRTLRWRLLLGNCLAHGSMLLRRRAILNAGGYDESCLRAQDYELWLRLGFTRAAIGCIPEVMYQHRTRCPIDPGKSTAEQAAIAAPLMLEAWRALPTLEAAEEEALAEALTSAVSRREGPAASIAEIEEVMAASPSREALMAWLWAQWHHPPMHRRAAETCRLSRLREVGAMIRAAGAHAIYLWGAGDHTRWLLEHRGALGLEITGIVDDHTQGERWGQRILRPDAVESGQHVLISSDWHEDAIWESSAAARARGIHVWRIYG